MAIKEFKQSVLVINFNPDQLDEDIEMMISDFYNKHQKRIIGMNALHLKKNLNKFKEIREVCAIVK